MQNQRDSLAIRQKKRNFAPFFCEKEKVILNYMKMKKIYSILLSAAVLFSSSIASAQQLPNAGFENWQTTESTPWTGGYGSVKIGYNPENWCISHVMGITKRGLVPAGTGKVALGEKLGSGYNSSCAVKLYNKETGAAGVYRNVPGYVTLGTTWSTANGSKSESHDGGTFGGIEFKNRPDALQFMYKHEYASPSDTSEPCSFIAYMWNGSYSQKDVPVTITDGIFSSPTKVTMTNRERNILGKECKVGGTATPSSDFQLIASIEVTESGEKTEWTRAELPFEYKSDAIPSMLNIIFSTNDYFNFNAASTIDNSISVDDVKLVYYSRLATLSVKGVNVSGFDSNIYNYTIDEEMPDASAFAFTTMGNSGSASASISLDEENAIATITVVNSNAGGTDVDGESSHTYVLQYKKVGEEKVGVSTEYPGYLNGVIIDTETNENYPFAENEEKVITITEYEDGTCDFLLPDLYLSMLEMSLGDILVEGATVTKGADGVATYEGFVDDMPLLGGELIADVTLNGTISAAGVVEMTINVDWDGVPIVCTFTTNQVTGVENIIIENQGNVEYYNLQGVKVANPENGVFIRVQGGKATKVAM